MKKILLILLISTFCFAGFSQKKQFVHQNINHSTSLGYGILYNWYAVSNANFAPTDWKVPTNSEYLALDIYLGGAALAGGKLKEVGFTHWNSPNTNADNTSNFTWWGAGYRDAASGIFYGLKTDGVFWTNTEQSLNYSYQLGIRYNSGAVSENSYALKTKGLSIRLLYAGAGTPTTITDYDGNIYDVVHIGTQYWTKQNWKCTHLNDGTLIPEVTVSATWAALTTLARCAYNNDPSNI